MNTKGNEKYMNFSANTINRETCQVLNGKIINVPSILIAKRGAAIFSDRKRITVSPFVVDSNMMVLTPNSLMDIEFFYYLTNTIKFGRYVNVGALPAYNLLDISSVKCCITNLKEQRKIANFLALVDKKIVYYYNNLNQFNNFKKYLLQNLFPKSGELAPKLRFKKDNGNEYSKWEEYTIKELFDVITDYVAAGSFATIKSNVKYLSEPNFAELIRTADLKSKFKNHDFVFVDEHSFNFLWRVNLNEECIVLPNIGNIGEVYFINPNNLPYKNNVLGPNSILLKSKNNIIFKYYLLSSPLFKHYLNVINESTGRGKFNKTNLKKIKTHVPLDKEEQTKISKILLFIDKKIDLIQDQIEKTEEFKKGLLQQMFEFLLFAFLFLIFCKYLCDSNPIVYLCAIFRFIFNLIINLKFQLILVFPIGLKIYIKIK